MYEKILYDLTLPETIIYHGVITDCNKKCWFCDDKYKDKYFIHCRYGPNLIDWTSHRRCILSRLIKIYGTNYILDYKNKSESVLIDVPFRYFDGIVEWVVNFDVYRKLHRNTKIIAVLYNVNNCNKPYYSKPLDDDICDGLEVVKPYHPPGYTVEYNWCLHDVYSYRVWVLCLEE